MNNFQNSTFTPANASAQVRAHWRNFEQSEAKDRAQLDLAVQAALKKADATWNKASTTGRMSRIEHNQTKARIAKAIKTPYFEKARAKWDEKLERAGLKAEHWIGLTDDEMRRISYTLGADDDDADSEDVVMVPELPRAPVPQPTQTPFIQPVAPSFSSSSRATNLSSSSYAFVNPSEFNSEDEDFEFDIPFSNPVATSVDLTSEEDDDVAFPIPVYPGTRPNFVGSGFSRASSLQSSVSNISEPSFTRPLASDSAYNMAPNRMASTTKRPQVSQNEAKSTTTSKARIPRQPYVGPNLDVADEPIDEELEFEKFKMKTRIEKIVEFHEAAALAEISLSIEIYKARKQLNNGKEEDAPRVLEHQKRMVQLQKEKEEERKAIVKSERARRQSDLGRRLTRAAAKEPPVSNGTFKSWGLSSFEDEIPHDLTSRFNLDTLLSSDPANQEINVESLLNDMFADNSQAFAVPDISHANIFNGYSSASSNQDAYRGSASTHNTQEQPRQSHQPMSWNKPQSNPPPKPTRKTYLSPFGESSDEEDNKPTTTRKSSNESIGWGIDQSNAKATVPTWNNQNAATPVVAGPSKDVHSTPVGSAWTNKKTTASVPRPRQGSSILSKPNSFFDTDDVEPEPTTTPVTNPTTAKGKKPWGAAPEKSSASPPAVETTTSSNKAPAAETPAISSKVDKPAPVPAPVPAPPPAGKKQNKKQRQANKKGGAATAPAVAEPAIPEQAPEPELVPPKRESPKIETPAPAPEPMLQASNHNSWLPKMVPAMARARKDSESTTPSWDEVTSTPRPASKIPAHVQEAVKSEGTPRPTMLRKQNLMAEGFNATSSRTTLEQMPPASITKGPIWGSTPIAPSPGPSLWGRTKADFETAKAVQQPVGGDPAPSLWGKTKVDFETVKVAQQPAGVDPVPSLWGKTKVDFETPKGVQQPPGGDFWVPGGFDGVDDYNDEGVGDGGGGGGGDEDVGVGMWESMVTHTKQIGKAAPIPVKQQPSVTTQRLRRVSEAASSPAPRVLGTKGISDITPSTMNSNSKKGKGKKNVKGKRATIEDVSDEEKDNIDILPIDSGFIMESKVILEPKPSIPTAGYSSIIDFADNDDGNNDNGHSSSSFRPTASTPSSSSPEGIFGGESRFAFKTQGSNTSSGVDWNAIGGGKHARWTPAINQDTETPSSSNFSTFGTRLPAKPGAQQTPIWGQHKLSAKDKGKGK